jgi:hypothetical protein
MTEPPALITNDAVVLGILITILGLVFITSSEKPTIRNSTVLSHRYYAILFQQFSTPSILYLVKLQFIHNCLALFITCKFSVTHIEYHFVVFKRLEAKQSLCFSRTVGIIIGGPLALYIS